MSYDYEALYASEPDALGGQTKALATFLGKIAPALSYPRCRLRAGA